MAAYRAPSPADHETVVRALSSALAHRQRVKVEPAEGSLGGEETPAVILRDPATHRLLRVCVIETSRLIGRLCSERWQRMSRMGPLTLFVPKGVAQDAERLLRTEARVIEYELGGDHEVVFSPPP